MRGAAFSIMSDMQEYLHIPAKGGSKPVCEHFPKDLYQVLLGIYFVFYFKNDNASYREHGFS